MSETLQSLDELLQQIANEQNFVDYDLKVTPVSSGGANYTSSLYDVTFTEGGKDTYMFAKVAAIGEAMRTEIPKVYKTENFVYTTLSKFYERLEDKHQLEPEHRLAFTKFYGCNNKSYEETIVLENLVKSGFESFDRFKPMYKEYAYSALRELAKLHALSFAYAEYYPEKFNKTAEILKFDWNMECGTMGNYYERVVSQAIKVTKEEFREPLQKFLKEAPTNAFMKYMQTTKRPVLGHGDYRPNNLMHRNRDDGTVEIKILDLQTMQASSPVADLLYFIFTSSDEKFRAQYYEKLVAHYYTELHKAMKRLHLDPENIYSRTDFECELKEKLPFGLIVAIFTLPIVTVDTENAPEVNEDLDFGEFSVDKTNDMYAERMNGVVSDYVKFGILK